MRHRVLQRALVVLQHARDPLLAAAGLPGLDDAERACLAGIDPRALATDPGRRSRMLATLAEEYKASATLIVSTSGKQAALFDFFAHPSFVDAVMHDGSLAVAFGVYLADRARGLLAGDVVRLESARVRCRREVAQPPQPGLGLAPGVACVRVDAMALELMNAVERWLHDVVRLPQLALASDRPAVPGLVPARTQQAYALGPSGSDIAFAPIDDDLAGVLEALVPTRPLGQAQDALVAAGVPRAQVKGLVEALIDDGLVASV